MENKTSQKIIDYICDKKQVTAKELVGYLEISQRAVFKQLKNLTEKSLLSKLGKPPKVFYILAEKPKEEAEYPAINDNVRKIIEENFLLITPLGEIKEGLDGFVYWCVKNNLKPVKTSAEYIKTLKKYNAFKKDSFVDGIYKMKNTFDHVYLDNLFYLDFYSIERFGKTKLGQLLLYAKQSQNKEFIKTLIQKIKPQVDFLIKKYKIDAIGFIPPTVKREIQFMKELESRLHAKVQKIPITKIKTALIIPQKTLNKLDDRIQNAKTTFIVEAVNTFKNILLIDDAVGSGATLNEVAAQIKSKKLAKKVIGLSVTGSFKGFDVISEV